MHHGPGPPTVCHVDCSRPDRLQADSRRSRHETRSMLSVLICVHPWLASAFLRVFRVIRGASLSSAHLRVLCGPHQRFRACESGFITGADPGRWHLLSSAAALDVRSPPGWFSRQPVTTHLGRHNEPAGMHNMHNLHSDKFSETPTLQRFKSKNDHAKKLASYA